MIPRERGARVVASSYTSRVFHTASTLTCGSSFAFPLALNMQAAGAMELNDVALFGALLCVRNRRETPPLARISRAEICARARKLEPLRVMRMSHATEIYTEIHRTIGSCRLNIANPHRRSLARIRPREIGARARIFRR